MNSFPLILARRALRSLSGATYGLGLLAIFALRAPCGGDEATTEGSRSDEGADGSEPAAYSSQDAGAAPNKSQDAADAASLSPLCGAGCLPDEANACSAVGGVTDSGADASRVDAAALPRIGCRITKISTVVSSVCADTGLGAENTVCSKSSDCAAGLECTENANGTGVCRRYCCSTTCGNPERFCDIGNIVGTTIRVPVCEPVRDCALLGLSNACAASETCAVVREDGTTGCVRAGDAKEGESCDSARCGAGLTCLGPAAGRTCFKLCRVEADGGAQKCATNQTCRWAPPLFRDMGIGICVAK